MGKFEKDCPECGEELKRSTYKDVLELYGQYF